MVAQARGNINEGNIDSSSEGPRGAAVAVNVPCCGAQCRHPSSAGPVPLQPGVPATAAVAAQQLLWLGLHATRMDGMDMAGFLTLQQARSMVATMVRGSERGVGLSERRTRQSIFFRHCCGHRSRSWQRHCSMILNPSIAAPSMGPVRKVHPLAVSCLLLPSGGGHG